MESLLRTQVSEFLLKDALKIRGDRATCEGVHKGTSAGSMEQSALSVCAVCGFCFYTVSESSRAGAVCKVLYNGKPDRAGDDPLVWKESMRQKPIRIYDEKDHFIGIYEFQQERETSNLWKCLWKNEIYKNTLDFYVGEPTVISLGKFDGIHRGHEL